MSKRFSTKRRAKYVMLALALTASFSMTSLAACADKSDEKEEETTVSKVDPQLLKNGNFEFFDVPKAEKDGNEPVYLINSPNNWARGGTTPYTMSGIINTNKSAWELLDADDLGEKLDVNNALNKNDADYKANYVDYNGMKSTDLLYKDSYSALKTGDIKSSEENGNTVYKLDDTVVYRNDAGEYFFDAEFQKPLKEKIENPGTHYNVEGNDTEGYYYMNGDEKVKVYKDEKGDFYLSYNEETKEYSDTFTNVLMLHNYSSSNHNGISQNYSSLSLTLPANTAAEVSLWVKTGELLFDKGTAVTQDRGAYIAVTHTVGGTTLDDFKISSINTQKLIANDKTLNTNNGWLQYSVYVNSCDFAESTITLKLGLGENNYTVEGYAFFDDVTVKKVSTPYDSDDFDDGAVCNLSSSSDDKIFIADKYERNGGAENGGITDPRSSENFRYLLDLASESEYVKYDFSSSGSNLSAGLTVDTNDYSSSLDANGTSITSNIKKIPLDSKTKLPDELKNIKVDGNANGLITSDDMIALVKANHEFRSSDTSYASVLNPALATAKGLPKSDANSDVLVMLSARGAAYTSSFDFSVGDNKNVLISFWLKTSDMEGNTAATLKLTDKKNDDVTASFTADTTGVVTDIDDAKTGDENLKDIYKGWVQCFFFVKNNDKITRDLNFELKFGNTAISDTKVSSYKSGWLMLANVQTLELDDDTYSYTSTGTYAAELTLNENEVSYTDAFDEPLGNISHEIENGPVDPSKYYGVNGGSSAVKNNGSVSLPYDEINQKDGDESFAGLINKDYAEKYIDKEWFKNLLADFGVNYSTTDAMTAWKNLFGETSYQPLVILNKIREVGERKAINYGFIGENSSASANTYSVVSVKVKVSKGAVAYIYLVDTSADKKVLSFETPKHSFFYDEDGNVLKKEIDEDASLAERKANVLYTLRSDGLYEDAEGKLFANTWNYTKLYKDETLSYYDENGNLVSFEELDENETYYANPEKTKEVNHFLVTSDGVKVFEYKDGAYYYIVEGKTQTQIIAPFNPQFSRYDNSSAEYKAVVDARYNANGELLQGETGYDKDGNLVAGKWITVSFVIHTGSEAKNYRLELWSGSRENGGVNENGEATEMLDGSSVIFDYSYYTVSDDNLKTWYESEIIKAYRTLLADKGLLDDNAIKTSTENIGYYEALVYGGKINGEAVNGYLPDGKLSESDISRFPILSKYSARYYTFSLYDSTDFRPFNEDVASENTTGYDYDINEYSETLAYLEIKDYSENSGEYTVFADYAALDQDIEFHTDEDTDDDDETKDDDTNVWLLASSILLVIALLFAMVAILVKDALKKRRRGKVTSKNNYNHNKAVRTMRKLKIKREEIEEVDAPASETEKHEDVEEPADKPAEPANDSEEPDGGTDDKE